MKRSLAPCIFLMMAGMAAAGARAAESRDSINLGLGGLNPMPHCNALVYLVEYEHPLSPTMAILGRGSGVNYRFNNGNYLEDGRLRGLDIGARYYRAGGMQGIFWGASLGYWGGDWTFIQHQNAPYQWQGSATSHSLRLNFELGDRIPIQGTSISIMPEANLGKFFSSRSCVATAPASLTGTPCSQRSEVNAYLFFGVTIGMTF